MARILRQYGVERDRLTQLYDENATKDGILGHILGPFRRDVGPNDSVLIYFAGNCQVDPKTKDVGLLPAGAVEDVSTSFISMKDLQDVLGVVPARHIFLAVDSCVGDLLVGTSKISGDPTVREVYQKKSRWVLAAGVLAPQPEGGEAQPGPSVFTQAIWGVLPSFACPSAARLHPCGDLQRKRQRSELAKTQTRRFSVRTGVNDGSGLHDCLWRSHRFGSMGLRHEGRSRCPAN